MKINILFTSQITYQHYIIHSGWWVFTHRKLMRQFHVREKLYDCKILIIGEILKSCLGSHLFAIAVNLQPRRGSK